MFVLPSEGGVEIRIMQLLNAGGAVSPRPYQSMTVAGIGQASGVTPRDGSPDSDWPTPDGVGCQESARVAPPVTHRGVE